MHTNSKLTFEQIEEIRWLASTGWKQRILAKTYGVSQVAISKYINKKRRVKW